jgi:hypothetical protein
LARKKYCEEEEEEKRKQEEGKNRQSALLTGDEETVKMIEAQIRFEELFRFDEARVRKEGELRKISTKEGIWVLSTFSTSFL